MQAGPGGFGTGLARDAMPPLFVLGRVIAPVSRRRAE
jgi:hypothetical protein